MATEVLDEHNTRCLVRSDSPAAPYINALKRRGFEYIVLPRLLLTGQAKPANMYYEAVQRASLLPSVSPTASVPAPLPIIRMADCLYTLVTLEGFCDIS